MSSATATTTTQIVEHIVLFKIKPEADPSKIDAMVNGLRSLSSIDGILHLTAGPIHHVESSTSGLTFTHILHIRFKSKQDLDSYTIHPSHVKVVNDSRPIGDDIMAIDWYANDQLAPAPGSAMRITLFKLKDEKMKPEVLGVIGALKVKIQSISFGENFSPDRAKGFSIGSILILPSTNELEAVDPDEEVKKKVEDLVAGVLIVDYVISPPEIVDAE